MSIFLTHDGVQYDIKSGNANDFHNNLPAIKADIKAMREIHLGEQKWFSRPQAWEIKEHFGLTTVTVYGEPSVEEPKKLPQPSLELDHWQFVPAICISDFEGEYIAVTSWLEESKISICMSSNWKGVKWVSPKSVLAYYPGDKNPENFILGVKQLTNWANIDWWFWADSELLFSWNTDTGFNPFPYRGWADGGGSDAVLYEVNSISPLYQSWLSGYYCDETMVISELASSNAWPYVADPPFGKVNPGNAPWYVWNDGYCAEYNPPECCSEDVRPTILILAARCGYGWLMTEIAAMAINEVGYLSRSYIMGICFSTFISCDFDSYMLFHKVVGSPQHRIITRGFEETYPFISEDDLRGSGAETFNFGFGARVNTQIDLRMPTVCETNQDHVETVDDVSPETDGFCGGFIQDDCEEEPLTGKYFVVYTEENEHRVWSAYCSPWKASGAGYDSSSGVYDHGGAGFCNDNISVSINSFRSLCANVNGERVLIDTGNTEDEYFECSDSHIYNAMGTPVYMYGYVKYRFISGVGYEAIYIRYGYFFGTADKHVQSEIFYPAGVIRHGSSGLISSLHDVFGSEENKMYGWGQCAGYLINIKTGELYGL